MMISIVIAITGRNIECKVRRGPRIPPLVEILVLFYDMLRNILNQNRQTSESQSKTRMAKYLLYSNFVLIVSEESRGIINNRFSRVLIRSGVATPPTHSGHSCRMYTSRHALILA